MEYLHYQLDCIGTDREVLRGLKLLGAGRLERLQGGTNLRTFLYSSCWTSRCISTTELLGLLGTDTLFRTL